MKPVRQEVSQLIQRSLDSQVRIAVTGLSRAGKTAFITSLVNQLLFSASHDNLPLFSAARDGRLLGARREVQTDLLIPRFAYDKAIDALVAAEPNWPEPTRDVSEIRLALKYKTAGKALKLLSKTSVLHLDIIDYPGEWLLDLPLLELDFATWSRQQMALLKGARAPFAKPWLDAAAQLDMTAVADDNELQRVAALYTEYLLRCKEAGLHWVQPGRFVLPGELAGAPVLQFFPCLAANEPGDKQSYYGVLKQRYEYYQQKVVKTFYQNYFSTFDRQIVLVDCLQPLNAGHEAFLDMRGALKQLMQSFRYGRNGLLRRLFAPKIDKVLFAATKADHVTPEQHANLTALLQHMVYPAWQDAAYENIDMSCMSIASVQATRSGNVTQGSKTTPALQGTTLAGDELTLFPGEVPQKLPDADYWQEQPFAFHGFRPRPCADDEPLPHLRIDKVLQYLLGDKLK